MKARAINFKQFIYFRSRVGSAEKRTTGRSLRMEEKKWRVHTGYSQYPAVINANVSITSANNLSLRFLNKSCDGFVIKHMI